MTDLTKMDRNELVALVKSLREANRRLEERVDSLTKQTSKLRQTHYDALPELDPYEGR